jgi:Tfp pilus assembly protein PilX
MRRSRRTNGPPMTQGMMPTGLQNRLRDLASSERGMALPVALLSMISSMALAGAAVIATVDVQRGTKHDSGSKSAIAAADAGVNMATMRLSRYANKLTSTEPCLAESGGTLVTSGSPANGWCGPIQGSIGAASYSYWVSRADLPCGTYDLCIVSTGTLDGVSRRIEMTYNESSLQNGGSTGDGTDKEGGSGGGSFEGLLGQDGIEVTGSADLRVGIGTNGEIIGHNKGSIVCGDMRVGIGKKKPEVQQCSNYDVTYGNSNLPPVSSFMPSNIATNNSNARITTCSKGLPVGCQTDGYTGSWTSKPPFGPKTRAISLEGHNALTVTGGDYWLCSLKFKGNSELIMGAGATVRFFFDTPENCGLPPGSTQIDLGGSNRITATGYQPDLKNFKMPGFYLLGSTTMETKVNLGGNNGSNEVIVYGPNTNIELSGSATYKGLVAGKWIKVTGSATVEEDAGFELPPELQPPAKDPTDGGGEQTPGDRFYTAQSYVECTGLPTGLEAPNVNC